jgi:hypothetical protein
MQSVGIILWKVKADWFRSLRCSSIVSLAILLVMLISILPTLGSEAFATDPTARTANGRVTAVASAKVIKPYIMTASVQPGIKALDAAITVSRRTTFRNCEILLGGNTKQAAETSCELRLIEWQ